MNNTAPVITILDKPEETKRKPIVFSHVWDDPVKIAKTTSVEPKKYKYIELVARNYFEGYDLMFAFKDTRYRSDGVIVIGQFNDGFVEQN